MTTTTQTEQAIAGALTAALRGEVIDREHPAYDRARRVWNGLIDRHPAVIAECTGTADVVEAVRIAREFRPEVSIRGGGHQIAGSAVCDDGLVIDLSRMRAVHVDPVARTARVQPGATWGEVDRETQLFGLATPGGEVSQTGVAGLTLGGGMGVLQRAHGLACDNLKSIEIVTADGAVRTASPDEHPDLFWAARGGGRGIGVVTSFEFALHPLGPDVALGQFLYPYEQAESVLREFRDLDPPESISPELVLWSFPPSPDVPAELHGAKVVIVLAVFAGPAAEAGDVLAPLGRLGTPLMDASGTLPYAAVQSSVDEAFPDGGRYYMKSHFADTIGDGAIRSILDADSRRPTPQSLIAVRTLGGAVARVGMEDTAFPHRTARYNVSFDASWSAPGQDAAAIGWARAAWDAYAPHARAGLYINFAGLDSDSGGDVRLAAFGSNAARLERIRQAYDPDDLFFAAAQRP